MTEATTEQAPPQLDAEREQFATALYSQLVRLYRLAHADQTRFLTRYDLTTQQHGVLACLLQENDLTFGEVTRRVGLHGSNLTGIVDRLAAKGLVIRVPEPADRRQMRLHLTDAGRDILRLVPLIDKDGLLYQGLEALGDPNAIALLRLLSDLGRAMNGDLFNDLVARLFALQRQA